jgi:hypothetical protein
MATPAIDNGQITQREKFFLLTSMFDEHQAHLENIESDNARHPDTPIISPSVASSSLASHPDVQNLWTTSTSLLKEPQAPAQQVQSPPTLLTVPLPQASTMKDPALPGLSSQAQQFRMYTSDSSMETEDDNSTGVDIDTGTERESIKAERRRERRRKRDQRENLLLKQMKMLQKLEEKMTLQESRMQQ